MKISNTEQKKELRLFGLTFWLMAFIDACHITIGMLYPMCDEAERALMIALMAYKAAVAMLKLSLGAWIIYQAKSCEGATRISPQVLRVFLAAFVISLLLDIYYCFRVSDLVYGLIEVCNSSIAFIPLLGCWKITKQAET